MHYKTIFLVIGFIITTTIANPNLRKGELIELAIIEETKENYGESLKAFAEIGKLAKNHIVDLSPKERNLFYTCYYYYQKQLMSKLICPENYLIDNAVDTLLEMYDGTKNIVRDLSIDVRADVDEEYEGFFQKVSGDKAHCIAWYSKSKPVNAKALRGSITMYLRALSILERLFGEQELLLLDTHLRLSMAKLELDALNKNKDARTCESALKGIEIGQSSTSEGSQALNLFFNTYCKDGNSNILARYNFRRVNGF